MVVMDDADLDVAIGACVNGAFFSTGQRCTASSRLIVTKGIYDKFVGALTEAADNLVVGDALDSATQIGPWSMKNSCNRMWITSNLQQTRAVMSAAGQSRMGLVFSKSLLCLPQQQMTCGSRVKKSLALVHL